MARIKCVKQPENENRGTSLSANDGRYDPINLSHGTYAFEIEKEGYKTEYIECLLEFGEHPFIEIVLREKTFVDHIIDNFMYLVVTLVVIIFIILITKK